LPDYTKVRQRATGVSALQFSSHYLFLSSLRWRNDRTMVDVYPCSHAPPQRAGFFNARCCSILICAPRGRALAEARVDRSVDRKMKHPELRWNPALEEWFCVKCGRTSDHINQEDAKTELEFFECKLPTTRAHDKKES
jgi:hypothetical protein